MGILVTLPLATRFQLLTTLRKKPFENIVVTNILSFFHNVFYPSPNKFQFLITFILPLANAFNSVWPKIFLSSKELRRFFFPENNKEIPIFSLYNLFSFSSLCRKRFKIKRLTCCFLYLPQ